MSRASGTAKTLSKTTAHYKTCKSNVFPVHAMQIHVGVKIEFYSFISPALDEEGE